VNTGVSAFFAFSGRVLYPYYADAPRILPLSVPDDQIAGGAFMWVAGSLPYLVPADIIVFHLVSSRNGRLRNSPVQRSLSV